MPQQPTTTTLANAAEMIAITTVDEAEVKIATTIADVVPKPIFKPVHASTAGLMDPVPTLVLNATVPSLGISLLPRLPTCRVAAKPGATG